ncbi:MAG: hypothetical protein WA102_05130 [Candidatus Methanoperedens sp.]
MSDDIIETLQRKIWTVEEITSQANDFIAKANQLPERAKKNIPVFSGDFSEENVKKFSEKIKESIRNPLRHKNKKLFEDIGIQTKGLSEEIFDDSKVIEEISSFFDDINKFNETVARILIEKEILLIWIREGTDKANEKLQEILDAKAAFQRIYNSGVNEYLRDTLLCKSISNHEFISSAEDILSKIKLVTEYGVSIEDKEDFNEFQITLENLWQKLENLLNEYKIPKDDMVALVNGKKLKDAKELLNDKLSEYSEKKRKLLEEWKMYTATLISIGHEVTEPPQGIQELSDGVEKLNSECMTALGKEGFSILQFLKYERDFPDDISKGGIKNALEILRPIFVKFLKDVE